MTKRPDILKKLKTGLLVLSAICLTLSFGLLGAKAAEPYNLGTIQLNDSPEGNSAAFKVVVDEDREGSSAFNREARMAKRMLDRVGRTRSLRPLFGYVSNLVGDGIDAYFDLRENIADYYEASTAHQFLKRYIPGYNQIYNGVKFVNNAVARAGRFLANGIFGRSNRDCNIERMNSIYKNGCYSCKVAGTIITTFINACSKVYDITKEAGRKVLFIGLMIWVVIFVLQQISSFKNIEPAAMVNDLLIMAFKVLGAYVIIGAGIDFFITYAIVPILSWGSQFGTMLLVGSSSAVGIDLASTEIDAGYLVGSAETGNILPTYLLNNLMVYIAATDSAVSTHMEVGHMLTCHATHAGVWVWAPPLAILPLKIANLWVLLSGVIIWCFGFMMTLSVAFYLVDISFKVGFSIIALPVVVGLWPFKITKDRLKACVGIILKSAGIFIFLAMTISVGLALVSNSFGIGAQADSLLMEAAVDHGTTTEEMSTVDVLMLAIEEGDTEYVADTFPFFGASFLVVMFAYFFAFKLIGSTMSDYVDPFFADSVFKGSPMHHKMTQVVAYVTDKAIKPVKEAYDIAKHQSKLALSGGFSKIMPGKFKPGEDKKDKKGFFARLGGAANTLSRISEGDLDVKQKEKDTSKMDSALQMAKLKGTDKDNLQSENDRGKGKGAEAQAKQVEQSMKSAGQAASEACKKAGDAADKICDAFGQLWIEPGQALSATGIGAIVGVPIMAFGSFCKAAGKVAKGACYVAAWVVEQALMLAGKIAGFAIRLGQKMLQMGKKMAQKVKKTTQKVQSKLKNVKDKFGKNNGDKSSGQSNNNSNDDDNKKNNKQEAGDGSVDANNKGGGGSDDLLDTMTKKPKK